MTMAQFYNTRTRKCMNDQGWTVIKFLADMLGFVFGIPSREKVLLTTEEEAVEIGRNDIASCKRHMNENW